MLRTRIVLAAIVAASVFALWGDADAECTAPREEKGAGAGGFLLGVATADFDDLNAELKSRGFTPLKSNNAVYGGLGYGIVRGRIIIGGEGVAFTQDVSSDTMQASFQGGYGFFDVGYVVYAKGGLNVFPLLGIGGSALDLWIVGKDETPSFGRLLDEPKREVNVSTVGLLVDLGIGVDYLLVLGEDQKGKGGLLLGFRAGYRLSPMQADWTMRDRDVLHGPDVRLTGPHVCLLIGGGGMTK